VVLTTPRAPALIVPDEQSWTMAGTDPAALGMRPAFAAGQAQRVLLPEAVPAPLQESVRSLLRELPADAETETRMLGGFATGALEEAHAEHGMHGGGHEIHAGGHPMDGPHDHMDGDHGDMMAIVGEPSADGLVMEPIEFRFGPLGTPLPGGLVADVTLDGDVVSDSEVQALLVADLSSREPPLPADPLAPVAWKLAVECVSAQEGGPSPWLQLAALETERAASHLAWLRAFGRLLGWQLLVDRCTQALEGVPALAHELAGNDQATSDPSASALAVLRPALERSEDVLALVRRSRLLRLRTAGLAPVTSEHAEDAGLHGPVARASGLRRDARCGHALYARLDFETVLDGRGDAHSRILVRAREAHDSLLLASRALREDAGETPSATPLAAPGEVLEGPRGPLSAEHATHGWQLTATGTTAALRTAGAAMVGAEWSDALVALTSFDLSPWRVGQ
jgi:hypothetical protein